MTSPRLEFQMILPSLARIFFSLWLSVGWMRKSWLFSFMMSGCPVQPAPLHVFLIPLTMVLPVPRWVFHLMFSLVGAEFP